MCKSSRDTWELAGITSYGESGCSEYSYFTKVSYVVEWVKETMATNMTSSESTASPLNTMPGNVTSIENATSATPP